MKEYLRNLGIGLFFIAKNVQVCEVNFTLSCKLVCTACMLHSHPLAFPQNTSHGRWKWRVVMVTI